ncbi:MAG: UdgX family uracil-DNA binding protein [Candidatus Sulfotelmatobacter sp.]
MPETLYAVYVRRNTNPAPRVMLTKRLIKSQRVAAEGSRPANSQISKTVPRSLAALRRAARDCKACDLWKNATQTVFGEGPTGAKLFLVGEQPGDQEDLTGHPFVGPAGKILNEALLQAGIDRAEVYVTNVVKHFKWAPAQRGKRRIHKKPRHSEIEACRPWLDAELRMVKPEVLVCLGATAAQALLGKEFSVIRQRGQLVESPLAPKVVATVHPSSILRAPDAAARQAQMQEFVRDLTRIAALL